METKETADRLAVLPAAIKEGHAAVVHGLRTTLEQARAAGDKLAEAKKLVNKSLGHGKWTEWLEINCPWASPGTLRGYMFIARNWDKILNCQFIDVLTIGNVRDS